MSNLKISQLEKITNMKEDSFVLAVQNGKNYKMSVKEAMNSYIDLSNYYTKEETVDTINDCIEAFEVVSDKGNHTTIGRLVNTVETQGDKIVELIAATDTAQSTADTALANAATAQSAADAAQDTANSAVTSINTINNTTIPGLQTSITSNTNLINTTKTELIGTENTDGTTIWGAKKYTDDLVKNLSSRIDSIVAGGVAFKGVVAALPSPANNGDLVIMSADYEITGKTYKKDYEYIYSNGTWYELGDSDKNAKAIAEVQAKATANATAISSMDAAYKAADSDLNSKINAVSNTAIKSITGGNSTYVTVSASAKDETGKVTLTVSDTIAATFDTQASVDGKISAAKDVLIGTEGIAGNTIWGAKKYTDEAVKALGDSFVAITADEINALFV